MHAALHINPYYGKTSMDGLVRHFSAVLHEGPTMIYNVPGRTGQDIPDDVVHRLADSPNFLGVKECTGTARIQARALKPKSQPSSSLLPALLEWRGTAMILKPQVPDPRPRIDPIILYPDPSKWVSTQPSLAAGNRPAIL